MSKCLRLLLTLILAWMVVQSGLAQTNVAPGIGITQRSTTGILSFWKPMNTTSLELSVEFKERVNVNTEFSLISISGVKAYTNSFGASFRVLKTKKQIAPLLAFNVGYMIHNQDANSKRKLSVYSINLNSNGTSFYLDHINYTMSAKLLADIRAKHFVVQTGLVYDFMKIRVRDLHGFYHSDLLTGLGLHFGVKYLFFKGEKENHDATR